MKRDFTIGGGMLERHELDAFIVLAEELHFGRTAERLGVSTTRVSQTIRKLERRVGVPLFHRTSRRVELTDAGRRLHDDVQPAWAQIGAAVRQAVAAGRGMTGELVVGFVGAAAGQLVIRVADGFRRRHPGCEVRIREAQIAEVVPWLHDGSVDVALTGLPVDDPLLDTGRALVREARMLAVSSQHPLARRDTVSVEDLAGVPMLQLPPTLPASTLRDRNPGSTPAGRPIPTGPPAATFQEALMLAGSGRGVLPVGAHVRRYYVRPDVAYVPFRDAPPVEWGLAWHRDRATAKVLAFARAADDLTTHDP
ncbi:LysR family transcriptional regulator [Dactylosporangium sp. NPDC049742]|uniref:LysR family transcriptional regulator n=1 Tax=Dactylosporangium sp. NPDC049742 TaxID=3154737 RepID=UPI0034129AA8